MAEELNFGRAADRLGVAHPQLSLMIKRAESLAGFVIFRRRPTVALTPGGAVLVQAARHAVDEIQAGISEGQEVALGKRGRVRLGFTGAAMFTELAGVLQQFVRSHPDVRLQLLEGATFESLDRLRARELDLSISREPAPHSDLRSHRIIADELVLALWEGHAAAKSPVINLRDLADEPFILINRSSASFSYDKIMFGLGAAGLAPRVVQNVDSWSATYALVRIRFGISIGTAASASLGFPGVVFRKIADPMPESGFWLSYDPRTLSSPAAKLIEMLEALPRRATA